MELHKGPTTPILTYSVLTGVNLNKSLSCVALYVLHDFGESLLIYMYSGLPLIAIKGENIMLVFLLTGDVECEI
jgi:hypothetical protein